MIKVSTAITLRATNKESPSDTDGVDASDTKALFTNGDRRGLKRKTHQITACSELGTGRPSGTDQLGEDYGRPVA